MNLVNNTKFTLELKKSINWVILKLESKESNSSHPNKNLQFSGNGSDTQRHFEKRERTRNRKHYTSLVKRSASPETDQEKVRQKKKTI